MALRSNSINLELPVSGPHLNEDSYVHFMEAMKTIVLAEFSPPSMLSHLESPFTWLQVLDPKTFVKPDTFLKLQDYPEEDPDGVYTFEKFCLHLIKVFQFVLIKDRENVEQSLQQFKLVLEKISQNKSDYIYSRIGPAFEYVLSTLAAQISYLNSDLTEEGYRKIGWNLMPFAEMEPEVKAGIQAIKGRFYLYMQIDNTMGIKHMKKATELDPECGAWFYWTGKMLRKERKHNKSNSLEEELTYFETAVKKKYDPKHILFLAQCYREKASYLWYEYKNNLSEKAGEINMYNSKSKELYWECWRLKKDSAAINRRLGNGIMCLPQPSKDDYALAEKTLWLAMKFSNNPITYHILGTFYNKHKQDHKKAIEYFTKGAENGLMHCFHDLIRLKFICDPNYDPYEDLKKMEELLRYSVDMPSVHGDLAWYFLTFKPDPDLCKAIEYFWKILETKEDNWLTSFRSYTFLLDYHVNIYAILKKEIEMLQEKDSEIFTKFLNKITENPNLITNNEIDTLSSIKADISSKLENKRKTFRIYNKDEERGRERTANSSYSPRKQEPRNKRTDSANESVNWRSECKFK